MLFKIAGIFLSGYKEQGIKKDIYRAIELFERAIKLGNTYSMYNLALIYDKGDKESKLERDVEKSCFLFYQCFKGNHPNPKSKIFFRNLIDKEQNKIIWRKEYHTYWKKKDLLNPKIILLLLISKHRKDFQNITINGVFLKGITMEMIKYLCHFSKN